MKALSFVSLIALGLTGVACSESDPQVTETAEPSAEVVKTAAPVDDGFNLPTPGGDLPSASTSDDGFNLSIPASTEPVSSDGFNLPSVPESSTTLSDLPEIDTSILEEPGEDLPTLTSEPTDDEPVIRIE